jgi:hypothetical protein
MHDVAADARDRDLLQALARPDVVDQELRSPALRLMLGTSAREAALAPGATLRLALCLALELASATSPHCWLRCSGAPGGEHDGRLTMQDLRDLGSGADIALVRNHAGTVDPIAEAAAMAGFAGALWSGGTGSVVTAGAADSARGSRLVEALVAARRSEADGIAAWCDALRAELGSGSLPAAGWGVRLWCIPESGRSR